MIHKSTSQIPSHVQVTFEIPRSLWADQVFLVGDFNQWNPTATPLHQTRAGDWRISIDLPAGGSYAFQYLIDGHYHTDYRADGSINHDWGNMASVVDLTLH